MWTAMMYKELRETVGIAAIAVGLLALTISAELGLSLFSRGNMPRVIPFLGSTFYFATIGVGLAIVLGFRQTAGELWANTFLFLLHRPVSRNQIIGTKLAIGLVVYLVCTFTPAFLYACWAALPGNHASPFLWEMTLPIVRTWVGLTIVYFGAFTSGLIDGRWFGRRLLPLAGAGLAATLAIATPALVGIPTMIFCWVVGLTVCFHVALSRDYS